MNLTKRIRNAAGSIFPRMKPSAICIGAQKGGTTALYRYFSEHPYVVTASTKEIDFFNCSARYEKGLRFYTSYFPRSSPANRRKVALDVTPGYLAAAEFAAPRISDFDPDAKIIALLREPGARAFSAWNMYRRLKAEDPDWFFKWMARCDAAAAETIERRSEQFGADFADDISEEIAAEAGGSKIEMPILRLGRYAELLRPYLESFGEERILVVRSEDLKADTAGILKRVEEFLEVNPFDWKAEDLRPRFSGSYEDSIGDRAASLLEEHYRSSLLVLGGMFPGISWDK